MKKSLFPNLLIVALSLFINSLCLSQSQSHDSRLDITFDPVQIDNWKINHPQILSFWEYYLDHSYIIIDSEAQKINPDWPSISVNQTENINIMSIPHVLNAEKRQYFNITGSNKILLIYSQAEILTTYNSKSSD